jgi:4-amino-4-deoxy-L-arabinose transferase-like glycosyltransferase
LIVLVILEARRYVPCIGWALLAFTVLFWRLGAASFWDPDEAHYAQTTQELIATGDWLTPYYNDQPFFDKPILFHLLQAVPMQVLGPTETAARLVPALAALATIGFTWWLGATLASADVGLVAALLLTTNAGLFALARYAILDTVFTAFLFGGVALLTVAALRDRPRLQYGGYVLVALATLTKGPVALALCGVTFVLAIMVSADSRQRMLGLRLGSGMSILLLVAAPWFLYMLRRHGADFVDGYLKNENLLLFTRPLYGGQPPWWFYLRILPLALLPWTGLAIGRLYDDVRAAGKGEGPDTFEVLLWIWIVAIVGFFSMSRFKLDHYVFPAAPALCLVCARAWVDLRTDGTQLSNTGAHAGFRLVGPTLAVVGLVVGFLVHARLTLPPPALAMPIVLTLAGGCVTICSLRAARPPRAPWLAAAAMAMLYAGLLVWVVPAFEERKVVPDIARWVATHAGEDDRVGTYILNRWNAAFRFYTGRHTTLLQGPDTAPSFFDAPEPFFCVMLQPAYEAFIARGIPLQVVYAKDGMWATSGRALWRQKDVSARFVVVARAEQRSDEVAAAVYNRVPSGDAPRATVPHRRPRSRNRVPVLHASRGRS